MSTVGGSTTFQHDVFVSYAHDDNVPPPYDGAKGWVTTLVEWLDHAMRLPLQDKADIFMDHQRGPNEELTDTLLEKLRSSHTLLVVQSPSYLKSDWCQREIDNFVTESTHNHKTGNIFIAELSPVEIQQRHEHLRELSAIEFWARRPNSKVVDILGYAKPNTAEGSPYVLKVNELAHYLAEYINIARATPHKTVVCLAECSDELTETRDGVSFTLRQHGYEVAPASRHPKDSEHFYAGSVREDLKRASLFVQLLGEKPGATPEGWNDPPVIIQALQASEASRANALRILQWRAPDVRVDGGAYGELLRGVNVQACGIEEFKRAILASLASGSPAAAVATATVAQSDPAEKADGAEDLSIYVNADRIDRSIADQVGAVLRDLGVTTYLPLEPTKDQTPKDIREAEQDSLADSDAIVLIYGAAPPSWVQSQFAFSRKILAPKRRKIWGALLDGPPIDKPQAPVSSPQVLSLDCRTGVDAAKVAEFIEKLRGAAHA